MYSVKEFSFNSDKRFGAGGVEFDGAHENETCVMELFFLPGQVNAILFLYIC